jgi:predicted nuclease of predicted toxin-antitoxin system
VKLLLDNNLSPQIVALLAVQGHEAEHVRDHGMQSAPDEAVLELAAERGLVLISAYTDFGRLLQLSQASGPSVVLIRSAGSRRPPAQAKLLLDNLPAVEDDLTRGALVVFEDTRVRIRDLPLGG